MAYLQVLSYYNTFAGINVPVLNNYEPIVYKGVDVNDNRFYTDSAITQGGSNSLFRLSLADFFDLADGSILISIGPDTHSKVEWYRSGTWLKQRIIIEDEQVYDEGIMDHTTAEEWADVTSCYFIPYASYEYYDAALQLYKPIMYYRDADGYYKFTPQQISMPSIDVIRWLEENSGVIPPAVWDPVSHITGNSGQFSLNLFQVKSEYIGNGETAGTTRYTSHFVLSEQASIPRMAANLADGVETVVAYCGDNYLTFTRSTSMVDNNLMITVIIKMYFRSDTPVYTSYGIAYRADLTGSIPYLSFIIDTESELAAPFIVTYWTNTGEYNYGGRSLPSSQDMYEIFLWFQDNGVIHDGTYDSGTTDDGGEPGTPRPQDHIGPGTLPTLGGLNNGLVTLYLPSDAQMTQIAQFLWSDNVLDNFKK